MADTPDTPAPEQAKPTPRRRSPARKPAAPKSAGAEKSLVAKAEDSVTDAATAARDTVTDAADKVVKAVKPRSTTRATPRASTRATGSSARAAAPAKRSGPAPKRAPAKRAAAKPQDRSTLERATDVVTGRIGAAIAGGVAAAALLTLRSSARVKSGTDNKPANDSTAAPEVAEAKHAHQPDGTDSSKSFAAGIADENTVPDQA